VSTSAPIKRSSRASKKAKGSKKILFVRKILVEDLRIGDRLAPVLVGHPIYGAVAKNDRTVEVRLIDECAGQWRTHVHINKSDCYDMRSYVHVVVDERTITDQEESDEIFQHMVGMTRDQYRRELVRDLADRVMGR